MLSTSMFVTGFIIVSLYLVGLFYMINYSHNTQPEDMKSDKETGGVFK